MLSVSVRHFKRAKTINMRIIELAVDIVADTPQSSDGDLRPVRMGGKAAWTKERRAKPCWGAFKKNTTFLTKDNQSYCEEENMQLCLPGSLREHEGNEASGRIKTAKNWASKRKIHHKNFPFFWIFQVTWVKKFLSHILNTFLVTLAQTTLTKKALHFYRIIQTLQNVKREAFSTMLFW